MAGIECLAGIEIEYLALQLVADQRSNKVRISFTICGFHLPFADSTYSVRFLLTGADSATAQFSYTPVSMFVCGFHKLFFIPQIRLRIPQVRLFLERF